MVAGDVPGFDTARYGQFILQDDGVAFIGCGKDDFALRAAALEEGVFLALPHVGEDHMLGRAVAEGIVVQNDKSFGRCSPGDVGSAAAGGGLIGQNQPKNKGNFCIQF